MEICGDVQTGDKRAQEISRNGARQKPHSAQGPCHLGVCEKQGTPNKNTRIPLNKDPIRHP